MSKSLRDAFSCNIHHSLSPPFPQMRMEPGQYVRINFPLISHWEWHPFTLTSIPGDSSHSVHIRAIGDWTKSLYDFFDAQKPSAASAAAAAAVEAAARYGPDQPKTQMYVLGHSLVRSLVHSHRSLLCLLRPARFARALRCTLLFACLLTSLTPSLVGQGMVRWLFFCVLFYFGP